jgi:hypothetical protein
LPDIDPDASNTIIASSVQGDGFFSSALEADRVQLSSPTKAMIPKREFHPAAPLLNTDVPTIAQFSRKPLPTLPQESRMRRGFVPSWHSRKLIWGKRF